MIHRLLTGFVAAGLLFAAGCAQPRDSAPMTGNKVCVMSKEPVDDNSPTAQFEGQTVRFCCTSCVDEWNGLSDADKRAKLAALPK